MDTMAPENSEIIVTSHNPKYEFDNCKRYEPINNEIEIDRFTEELIEDDMYFFYGDTYYTEAAIKTIFNTKMPNTVFFGNNRSIVAIKVEDGTQFREHKSRVKRMFIEGKIEKCKGWQLYQSFTNQNMLCMPEIKENFVLIDDGTADINTPEDYFKFV
ncbi:MAG: hypothetical protein ACLRHC_07230 [Anaerovoracaceae bacterium]|nr:hypothetical protein [Bacillota bacterium]